MKKTAILILILLSTAASADLLIANTASWQNIYSAGLYAGLQKKDFKFLISGKHSILAAEEISPGTKITVIESDKTPFNKKYAELLSQKGFKTETILIPEKKGNLDLAKRAKTDSYIIVDPTYGYDAISAAPLAIKTNSYVIFADKENIDEVRRILQSMQAKKITIFGDVDEEVKEALAKYSPEILNKGNRFKNNIAIAEKYKQLTRAKQALLTNGGFIEEGFFDTKTNQPIIFIGEDQPPEEVTDHLETAGYSNLVLVGNNLLSSARQIKDRTGIPLIVKFGKGTTGGKDYYKHISGLDVYDLPVLEILLNLQGIYYNTKTGNIELVVKNEKEAKTYLRNSIIIKEDQTPIETLGDEEVQQLSDEEIKAFSYPIELQSPENLQAEIFIPYGASPDTFEKAISATMPITIITEDSECSVSIDELVYNERTQRFELGLSSTESCYAQATIEELTVDNEQTDISSEVKEIRGKTKVKIKQELNEVDMADNEKVKVVVKSGKRPEVLISTQEKTFEFKLKKKINPSYIVIAALLLIIAILWTRKKKR